MENTTPSTDVQGTQVTVSVDMFTTITWIIDGSPNLLETNAPTDTLSNATMKPEVTVPQVPRLPPSPVFFALKIIICAAVFLVTIIGNSLVLFSFATIRKLRTYTNYYTVSLAVADLSSGITPTLLNVPWLIGYWPFGSAVCTVVIYLNTVFVHATFLLTFIICVDRYRALSMPLKHLQEKNMRHAFKIIMPGFLIPVVIWAVVILIIPRYGFFRQVPPLKCYIPYASSGAVLLGASVIISWLPIIGTASLYSFLYFRIIRKRKKNNPTLKREDENIANRCDVSSSFGASRLVSSKQVKTYFPSFNPAYISDGEGHGEPVHAPRDAIEGSRGNVEMVTSPRIRPLPTSHYRRRMMASSRRATRTLAYIIVVMVISGTPYSIYSLLVTVWADIQHIHTVSWVRNGVGLYQACNFVIAKEKMARHKKLCTVFYSFLWHYRI